MTIQKYILTRNEFPTVQSIIVMSLQNTLFGITNQRIVSSYYNYTITV